MPVKDMIKGIRTHRASKSAQIAWYNMPKKLKKELKKTLEDEDRDGVPNGFDCHPRDPKRQEEFLSRDLRYLNEHPKVKLGKFLGKGCVGAVHDLKDNKNLVVKVVREYKGANDVIDELKDGEFGKRELKKESDDFKKYDLTHEPLFIPTRTVKIGNKIALVRPKVKMLVEYYPHFQVKNKELVTEAALKKLRKDLIDLSYKGFVFEDGLQLGIDEIGRILMYDIGFLRKDKPGSDRAFEVNNAHWTEFVNEFQGGISKYGKITKRKVVGQRTEIKGLNKRM
jgi:hypothetical protein